MSNHSQKQELPKRTLTWAQVGSKGSKVAGVDNLLSRVELLYKSPSIYSEELKAALLKIKEDLLNNKVEGVLAYDKIVKSLENILDKLTSQSEEIEHLKRYVEDLQDEVKFLKNDLIVRQYRAIYGDYCSHITVEIIMQYENENIDLPWDTLKLKYLKKERREYNFCYWPIEILYQQEGHSKLIKYINNNGFTIEDYELLLEFSKTRNDNSHSHLKSVLFSKNRENIHRECNQRLNQLTGDNYPSTLNNYKDVLIKTVGYIANKY
mmetsp:Transcript_6231/g.5567  ORF Transcript_6231/g.5567 Transcript_6231/m.5567 type:complete len:265 (+) Transcript_6231:62-856(+)